MTANEWQAEVCKRIGLSEGRCSEMYYDSLGIPTIGIGFNLQRDDAASALSKIGSNLHAVMGGLPLHDAQIDALFAYSFLPVIGQARLSLRHFDKLNDARRFVICDLVFNLGYSGWLGFSGTRSLIDAATITADDSARHTLYNEAANHLEGSAWYSQVGDRAKRDVAMLRGSVWVQADGDGSVT